MTATDKDTPQSEYGWLYWSVVHSKESIFKFAREHRAKFAVLAILVLIFLYIFRAAIHPTVIKLRIYSFDIALATFATYFVWRQHYRMTLKSWMVFFLVGAAILIPHDYLALYLHHAWLNKEELKSLPETGHERIQPLNSIRVIANQVMSRNEHPSDPYYVRIGGDYRWTMGVEPAYFVPRLHDNVVGVINVSATDSSPNFSKDKESRSQVEFPIGEHLLLGKNSKTFAIRALSFSQYLSYEPEDLKYLKDDSGNWVQVLSLTKWEGFIFPRPVFGGVQIIRQSKGGILYFARSIFVGDGEWISPEDIGKHKFLRGQNIVPFKVSRYTAQSFRFHEGFMAPMPGFHQGDIRIPDLPGDANDQPFTTFFHLDGGKLFHYFGAEPYQEDKQGLSLSILSPGDGIGSVKYYDHSAKGENMIGVSAVAGYVKADKKYLDWDNSRPAENRPFVRIFDGQPDFSWLTTVVTNKNDEKSHGDDYIAGSTPDVSLTNPLSRKVTWVDPDHQETWVAELRNSRNKNTKSDELKLQQR